MIHHTIDSCLFWFRRIQHIVRSCHVPCEVSVWLDVACPGQKKRCNNDHMSFVNNNIWRVSSRCIIKRIQVGHAVPWCHDKWLRHFYNHPVPMETWGLSNLWFICKAWIGFMRKVVKYLANRHQSHTNCGGCHSSAPLSFAGNIFDCAPPTIHRVRPKRQLSAEYMTNSWHYIGFMTLPLRHGDDKLFRWRTPSLLRLTFRILLPYGLPFVYPRELFIRWERGHPLDAYKLSRTICPVLG